MLLKEKIKHFKYIIFPPMYKKDELYISMAMTKKILRTISYHFCANYYKN